MKVIESKRKENTVHLKVEGSTDELNVAVDKAFKKLVKKAKVSGFRQGKVPRNIFERHYGKGVLIQEGIQDLVNTLYMQAIKELKLEVVDYPKNVDIAEYKEDKPVTFTCEVDVRPSVKLGKYKGLKVTHQAEEVSDDAVEKEIGYLQDNAGQYEVTEDAIQDKDIARADIIAKIGEEEVEAWTKENFGFKVGMNQFGPDFDAQILGLKTTDTKTFSIEYPEDFKTEAVAGQSVAFDLKILENRSRTAPELDDAFAKANSKYETLEELRAGIKENLSTSVEKRNKDALQELVLKELTENIDVSLQDVLIERESENSIRQLDQTLRQSGSDINKYCEITKKTVDDLKTDFRDGSIQKLKIDLAIEAVAEKEGFPVSDDDIKSEVKKWNVKELATDEAIDKYIEQAGRSQLEELVRRQKTIDFLIDHAKISNKSK